MKTISSTLRAHLGSEVTTLALCWKVTATDGTILAFTTHAADLTYNGVTYASANSGLPSALSVSSALNVDTLSLEGLLADAGFTEADIRAGKWDHATFDVFVVNYLDLTQGDAKIGRGVIGEQRTNRSTWESEVRGLAQFYQQKIIELYQPACQADLGDTRCGVTLATYTVTGSVTSVTNRRVFADSSRTEGNNRFTGGLLTWTAGLNQGLKMEVSAYVQTGGAFQLVLAMPNAVTVGDTYSVYAGCDKSLLGTHGCKTKFNNVVNFRGFPYVPQKQELAMPLRSA